MRQALPFRIDASGPAAFRLARGREGAHLVLLPFLAADADAGAALDAAATGHPFRRTGLPGAVVRVRVDRPDLLRIDWRPGRHVPDAEAAETLGGLLARVDLPVLLRRAGALDGGVVLRFAPGRAATLSEGVSHHPDALADAIADALAGRFPRGCLVRLGREPADDHPVPQPGRILVSPALRAALADVLDVAEISGGWAVAIRAARPAHRRPEPKVLLDADLPETVLAQAAEILTFPPATRAALARIGVGRIADLVGLPLGRVLGPGLTPDRIERLREAADDLAVTLTPRRASEETAPARETLPPMSAPSPAPELPDGFEAAPEPPPVPPVLPLLLRLVEALPVKHRAMMRDLAGLDGPEGTLGSAAAAGGYTKERARQILDLLLGRFLADPVGTALVERFRELVARTPLRFDDLAREPWSAGMRRETLAFLVRQIPGHGLRLARDDESGETLVTPLSTAAWQAQLRGGRAALSRLPATADRKTMALAVMHEMVGLPEPAVAAVIAHLMPPGYVPPRPSVAAALREILYRARRPMAYEEILDTYSVTCGQDLTTSQARNTLLLVAERDPATGLFELPVVFEEDPRLAAIVADIHRFVMRKGPLRHWLASELIAALPRRHAPVLAALGERGVNALLAADPRFLRRKAGAWLAAREEGRFPQRPNALAWAEILVTQAGGPMRSGALKAEVARTRGIQRFPVLYEHGRMVRLAPGLWGLYDRDLGLDEAGLRGVQAEAAAAVAAASLSIGELHARLAPTLPPTVTPTALRSLMLLDPGGPRVDNQGLVRAGDAPRQITGRLHAAVLAAAPEAETIEDVIRAVRRATGRIPSYTHVRRTAAQAGYALGTGPNGKEG